MENSTINATTEETSTVIRNLHLDAVISAYGTLVWIFVLVGNLVVIVLFCKSRKLRKFPSNWLILSLAFADLTGGSLNLPFMVLTSYMVRTSVYTIVTPTKEQMLDLFSQICHRWFMPNSSIFICLYSIFGIAFERYISVRFPLKNHLMVTKCKVGLYIATVWTLGITFNLTPLIISVAIRSTIQGNSTINETNTACHRMIHYQSTFRRVTNCLLPWPAIGITVIYTYILIVAFRHKKAIARYRQETGSNQQQGALWRLSKALSNAKAAKIYIIIYILFLLGWLPLLTVTTISEYCHHCNLRALMISVIPFGCITMLTSAINPWIYTLRTKDFREELSKLKLQCCMMLKKLPKCSCIHLRRRKSYDLSQPPLEETRNASSKRRRPSELGFEADFKVVPTKALSQVTHY